jgi:hypothetical protein
MLSQDLVQLIRGKPITPGDLQRATIFTLDAVANGIAGRNSLPGRKLLSWGQAQAETIIEGVLGLADAGPSPDVVRQVCTLLRS